MDPSPEIRFDVWTLRTRTGELLNAGTRVQLRPQQAQVLEE
jgi:DNA-binding winged helix-turn-helix (wHTH) protein